MNAKNVGASVYAKLKNLARERQIDMPVMLKRYAQERLLYRLSVSPVASEFCVKGGLLLTAYNSGNLLRPTEDIDFNGFRKGSTIETLRRSLEQVVTTPVEDDGVVFLLDTMNIKKEHIGIISGGKIVIGARIHTANVEVRVDVGFGNAITPGVKMLEMPTLLDSVAPRPMVLAYPLETVISEKYHAMAMFGAANTRIKDFFDIWTLIRIHDFEAQPLVSAIENTFEAQERPIPDMPLACLTEEYARDKQVAWTLFLEKIDERESIPFLDVISDLSDFAWPVMRAAQSGARLDLFWTHNAGWVKKPELALTI
ncbi:nucleotidyl transferase AbiEii/AbiGii toxin family protein [Pararhizobium sp. BT-229]|uniref:nucleotidyl transferase AbiEii/AbiGii toxin family protein n=1 Tax=Pararhizobium sp. BT-229 TaxID=2986923 RepID=UPI0021F6A35F|nr:nucleotidyl transferase AbiEii/AbiGii toxin family protein [Pararhizobium sp. BT-229]MCV9964357.1 nucleotidyl transferase AbiEii/AbiGii toxin family protein [Pararhizobium sp. BT-229]